MASPTGRVDGDERPFACSRCSKSFKRREHLNRHFRAHTLEKPFECRFCGKTYSRRDLVTRHEKTLHGPDRLPSTATATGTATTATATTTTTSSSATASAGTSHNNPFLAPFPPLDSPDSLRSLPMSGPSPHAHAHAHAAAAAAAAAAAFQEADAMIDPALFESILHQTPSADTASPLLSESTTSNDASQHASTGPGTVKRRRLMTRGTTTSISSDSIDTSPLPHAAYGSHPLP